MLKSFAARAKVAPAVVTSIVQNTSLKGDPTVAMAVAEGISFSAATDTCGPYYRYVISDTYSPPTDRAAASVAPRARTVKTR